MTPRLLILLLLPGCAAGGAPSSAPEAAADSGEVEEYVRPACQRDATVTVHVENSSGFDVAIAFGTYKPVRIAPSMSRTTYRIPRYYLQDYIRVRIARGGLEVSPPPPVATEFVVCNDATLIIGPRPSYSFFYGDVLQRPQPKPKQQEEERPDTTSVGP